jgi:hypothetical protein
MSSWKVHSDGTSGRIECRRCWLWSSQSQPNPVGGLGFGLRKGDKASGILMLRSDGVSRCAVVLVALYPVTGCNACRLQLLDLLIQNTDFRPARASCVNASESLEVSGPAQMEGLLAALITQTVESGMEKTLRHTKIWRKQLRFQPSAWFSGMG